MLAPSLAVEEHLKRNEVGIVKVKGIEIKRPVFLCNRKENQEHSSTISQFLRIIKMQKSTDLPS